tara:strand:+ start:2245 stop:3135 length:891 start_codon:yes stop_codon:yes gene_type:complete
MIVVDYNQTAIGNFMAEVKGRQDVEVNLPLLRHMIINTIRSYNKRYGDEFGDLVIACDNRYYWRKKVFPYYKANRRGARQASSFDWGEIFDALSIVRDELSEVFPYPVIDIDGAEADDVIGTLAEYSQTVGEPGVLFEDEVTPDPFLIISGDHDFQQLQKFRNVRQYAPAQKRWVKIKEPAEYVLMEHIIRGDKGDGIPNMFSDDDTFVKGARQRPVKTKDLQKWKKMKPEEFVNGEGAHGWNRNSLLVDLTKTPQDIKDAIIHSYEAQTNKDKSHLLDYFNKHKMRQMIDVIDEF